MSADANSPLGPTGSRSHIPGIVPDHKVANEGKGPPRRRQKRRRGAKPVRPQPEAPDVDQSLPDSEDNNGQGGSIDCLV